MDIKPSLHSDAIPECVVGIYRQLAPQAQALMADQRDRVANAANLSALINEQVDEINWVGFYFLAPDPLARASSVLMVGPFQGKPACVRIEIGRGVCGAAVATQQTQRVSDVHAFEGHIACDPNSRSEIVVPLFLNDEVFGVLDIDSPIADRFSADDQVGIEYLAKLYTDSLV